MLEVENLNFAYGDNTVFKDFSFRVNRGTSVCVEGPNGSGKTTLLKILCGLNYCENLRCKIDGIATAQSKLKKMVAYIPSAPLFYGTLSMREYISWVGSMWNTAESFCDDVKRNMQILGFEVDGNAEIETYSLGMKYKLYFCTFLALNKPIILLDEPLNSLDFESRQAAVTLIKKYISENNGCCIFSSHVKDTISQLSDRTISL